MRIQEYNKRIEALKELVNSKSEQGQFRKFSDLFSKIIRNETLTKAELNNWEQVKKEKPTPLIKYFVDLLAVCSKKESFQSINN